MSHGRKREWKAGGTRRETGRDEGGRGGDDGGGGGGWEEEAEVEEEKEEEEEGVWSSAEEGRERQKEVKEGKTGWQAWWRQKKERPSGWVGPSFQGTAQSRYRLLGCPSARALNMAPDTCGMEGTTATYVQQAPA